jgi:hypothetical protein
MDGVALSARQLVVIAVHRVFAGADHNFDIAALRT